MTFFGVLRLDRGDGVAGIDRAGEASVLLDRQDVAELHHVEQGGDARRDILAVGGGGGEEGVVMAHLVDRDRGDILGQLVLEMGGVGDMDLAHAGDLGRGLGDGADALASNEQMDLAQLRRRGDGGEGRNP